jgi:hypothetical protein
VLIDIEANQVSPAVRCIAARVNPVAVWGAESTGTAIVPRPTTSPLQASTVRNGAFHRVRKPRDHAGRGEGNDRRNQPDGECEGDLGSPL